MEHFVIIVNNWKPLTIITKSSILDVAAVLDPPLSKVKFETTGKVSKKLKDKRFFRKINDIIKVEESVANGVIYHNRCSENARSKVRPRQELNDSISHTLSETKVLNFYQTQLNDPNQPYLNINIANEIYEEMLLENGKQRENIARY